MSHYQTRPVGPLQPQWQGQSLPTSQLPLSIWKPEAGSLARNMKTNGTKKKNIKSANESLVVVFFLSTY